MKVILINLICLILIFCYKAYGDEANNSQTVFSKDGNIYFNTTQITHSGKDRSPVLSPDKKIIAFIRKGEKLVEDACITAESPSDKHVDQLWIYDVNDEEEHLLIANDGSCNKPEDMKTYIYDFQFSPDSKKIYFLTPGWTTSNALHVTNVDWTEQQFLLPALAFQVVNKGEYKNYLIVQQHRYFIGGGSYDWFWLFTPQKKEIGPIGPKIQDIQ